MTKEQFLKQIKPNDVIILQGVPGSGKSTLAKEMRAQFNNPSPIFSADHGMIFQGEYLFQPEKLERCHKDCLRRFLKYLDDTDSIGMDSVVIVDNTNTTNLEIAPYMAAANAYDRNCYVVTVNTPVEVALKRQTHGVPFKKVLSMADRIKNSLKTMPSYWGRYEITEE
jgi:predicted kinase